jgi:hypothetical protein
MSWGFVEVSFQLSSCGKGTVLTVIWKCLFVQGFRSLPSINKFGMRSSYHRSPVVIPVDLHAVGIKERQAIAQSKLSPQRSLRLFACRRNNKVEKWKRNYANALQYRSKDGISRKKKVKAEQRAAEVARQEGFPAQIFQHTTDDDIPRFDEIFD